MSKFTKVMLWIAAISWGIAAFARSKWLDELAKIPPKATIGDPGE